MAGTVSIKEMPRALAQHLSILASEMNQSNVFSAIKEDIIDESEQGVAPDWYTDPDEFRSLHHVGEYFVIDDYRDENQTDKEVLLDMLSSESDAHYLDVFQIEEFPNVSLAVMIEVQGQRGVWLNGVGVFNSMTALEKHLLDQYSFAVAGNKSTLDPEFILEHNSLKIRESDIRFKDSLMDIHTISKEGIALIKELLAIKDPIVFEASCMDHGQGAVMLLASSEHKEALSESDFDLSFWFYEKYHELRESNNSYWGGGGEFCIGQKNKEIFVEYRITKGSFSGCTSPMEEQFLNNVSAQIYNRVEELRPDLPVDELMIYLDLDFSYSSDHGVDKNKGKIKSSIIGSDAPALTLADTDVLEKMLCQTCEDAAKLFEDDIPFGVEPSIQLSCENCFIEEVQFDAELYYDISSTFKLA